MVSSNQQEKTKGFFSFEKKGNLAPAVMKQGSKTLLGLLERKKDKVCNLRHIESTIGIEAEKKENEDQRTVHFVRQLLYYFTKVEK